MVYNLAGIKEIICLSRNEHPGRCYNTPGAMLFSLVVFVRGCYLIYMIENFRYGTKEIVVTVIGAALAILTYYLESMFIAPGAGPAGLLGYMHLRILVVTIAAVFFGPVAGVLVGLGGELLINVMFMPGINYANIIALGFYGAFVGLYFGKLHFDPKDLSGRTFIDFAATQLMAGIFCEMLILPLFEFLLTGRDLYTAVTDGCMIVVVNSVINMLICPIIIGIVHIFRRTPTRAHT